MEDRAKEIFGNKISKKKYKKGVRNKKKFIKKNGDDSAKFYETTVEDNKYIGDILGVKDIKLKEAMDIVK